MATSANNQLFTTFYASTFSLSPPPSLFNLISYVALLYALLPSLKTRVNSHTRVCVRVRARAHIYIPPV